MTIMDCFAVLAMTVWRVIARSERSERRGNLYLKSTFLKQ